MASGCFAIDVVISNPDAPEGVTLGNAIVAFVLDNAT